jgi:hypothetical protein
MPLGNSRQHGSLLGSFGFCDTLTLALGPTNRQVGLQLNPVGKLSALKFQHSAESTEAPNEARGDRSQKTFVFRFFRTYQNMGERPANFLSRKLVREIKTPETRRVDSFRVSSLRRPVSIEFKGSSPTNPVVVVRPAEDGQRQSEGQNPEGLSVAGVFAFNPSAR